MLQPISFIILGLAAGILSGLIGVGGGILIVPALVLIWGFSQQTAQGTSLAMLLLPTGILAVYTYYKAGYVDVRVALLIALGFVLGGLFGAKIATSIPTAALKKVFGIILFLISLKMVFGK